VDAVARRDQAIEPLHLEISPLARFRPISDMSQPAVDLKQAALAAAARAAAFCATASPATLPGSARPVAGGMAVVREGPLPRAAEKALLSLAHTAKLVTPQLPRISTATMAPPRAAIAADAVPVRLDAAGAEAAKVGQKRSKSTRPLTAAAATVAASKGPAAALDGTRAPIISPELKRDLLVSAPSFPAAGLCVCGACCRACS